MVRHRPVMNLEFWLYGLNRKSKRRYIMDVYEQFNEIWGNSLKTNAPNEKGLADIKRVREACLNLINIMSEVCPNSTDLEYAITSFLQANKYAASAIGLVNQVHDPSRDTPRGTNQVAVEAIGEIINQEG